MKRNKLLSISIATLTFFSLPVLADNTGVVKTDTTQHTQAAAITDGNKQSITFNTPASSGLQQYAGQYTIKTAPQVNAPGLTSSFQDTCMGSSSAGVSIIGVGATAATTWKDEECVRRLNAREIANTLGDRDVAKELMCGNPEVFAAYQAIGRPCKLSPSTSTLIPGGALKNYREPVKSEQVADNDSDITPVSTKPVVPAKAQTPQEKAEIARMEMKQRLGF